MPMPLLGAADSFNSSGATIVPDKSRSGSSSTQAQAQAHTRFYPGRNDTPPRGLVSQDSLEGHITSALRVGGDDGMIGLLQNQTQDMGGNGLSGLSFMRDFIHSDDSQPSPSFSSHQHPLPSPNGLPDPGPGDLFNPSEFIGHSHLYASPAPQSVPHFRPSSAHSHHSAASSIVDPSEYYSTTDIDTDDDDLSSVHDVPGLAVNSNIGDLGMGEMDLTNRPAVMTWTAYQPSHMHQGGGISPNNMNNVVSPAEIGIPPAVSPSALSSDSRNPAGPSRPNRGSVRGVGGQDGGKKPLDKLEHRRDINRRSAQKHRARRKEEMEHMTRAIAERDARIAQLERDLQVEKARNDQLRNLVNARLAGAEGFP